MITISKQLRKYFIITSMLSIFFITITVNISINLFFSDYLKGTRSRDDKKVIQYVEQVYSDSNELNSQSLMSITHYTLSEAVMVRIKGMDNKVIWDSGMPDSMNSMMEDINSSDETSIDGSSITYKSYPFSDKGTQVGTVDIGRPRRILSSIEDKQFLTTINAVFAMTLLFTMGIAVITSSSIARKFLNPIYRIKENAKFIENGKYKNLKEVKTNTYELNDLSISIKELAERLDYQQTLRKRMTSDISHELRTPIATIQSHIEAFMDGVWNPDIEKLSIVHNEVIRLTKLIQELSDLSIIESDEIKLSISKLNLSALLDNSLESFEPMFMSKNISLDKQIQGNVELAGDEALLHRVFVNILSNAYKYTNENGCVMVTLEDVKDIIKITVKDSGIGIPKEDIKHIFERFYRSDLSRNRGTGGTGIGLTITKGLVEAHNGSVRIASEEGKGTIVVVEFEKQI